MSNKYRFPNKSINKMFLHTAPYTPPLFQKKVRSPSQNLLKTFTFHPSLLIFTVVEVCNITNKNQSPSNLAKYQYFYTRDFIYPSFISEKIGALHRRGFSKHPLFTTFSLFLKVSEVCNISNKC